jgi:hypothetical protein
MDAVKAALKPIEARLFEIICRSPGLTQLELADRLYADDPNGGPDNASAAIGSLVNATNVKLIPFRLRLRGNKHYGHRLERIEPQKRERRK